MVIDLSGWRAAGQIFMGIGDIFIICLIWRLGGLGNEIKSMA